MRMPRCWSLHMQPHSSKKLRKLKASIDKQMSRFAPPHSKRREQLAHAEIVIMFTGEHAAAADGEKADDAVVPEPNILFGHIAEQILSPWNSWFQEARPAAALDSGGDVLREGPMRIHVAGEFYHFGVNACRS